MKSNLAIAILVSIAQLTVAQVPKTLSFQGYLVNSSSNDPLDGNFDMKFSLYDASSGGAELWVDDYSSVPVTKGLYNVNLGDKKDINLPFDKTYYLQVKVGLENLTPRIVVTSSAYSLSSINASNITTGILNGALVGTGINAANITTGTIPDTRLSPNVQDLADGTLSASKVGFTAGPNIIFTPSGSDIQISTGGSALSGTGTNGQVAFWTGPGSFSSDNAMVWDNTNKRLGLGVSPTQKLDVSGTVKATSFSGIGSGITSLNATNVASGTLADARLESTVDLNALNVGSSGQFSINSSGDLTKLNNVAYSFPLTQATGLSFLSNNGAGSLSWANTIPGSQVGSGIDASRITSGSLPMARIDDGAVVNVKLGSDIDASKLTSGTLPIARIADGAIGTSKIGDGAVGTIDIGDDVVTFEKLRDDATTDANRAVTTNHVRDGAIVNAKLGTDIDAAKLTAGTLPIARIADGAIVNAKLGSDLDAGKLTTGSLPMARINDGAVTNVKLGSDIDASKLTSGTLPIARIADGAITTSKIGDGAVGAVDIGDDAVTFEKLRDDATTDANRAVTTNHVRDGAIVNAKLGTDLDAAKLTTGTLPVARIADGAIVNAKLGSDLDAGKFTTGSLPMSRIDDGSVTNAKLGSDIDASKLTSGTLPIARIADGALTSFKIADDAVTFEKLRDDATTDANRAVTTNHVRDGAIVNAKLGTDLDAAKLTSGTLSAARIADGAIVSAKLGTDLDASKLTAGTLPIARIADGAVVNAKLGTDLDAGKLTAGTLPIGRIGDGAITSLKITDATIATADIADGAITSLKIGDGTIASADIADDAITFDKLRDDAAVDANRAVTTNHIRDGAIVNTKLGTDLDASKLTAGTLPISRIADGAITSLKIFDGAIATEDIADDAVTFDKLRDDATTDGNRAVTTNHVRDGAIVNAKLGTDLDASKLTAGTLPIGRIADGAVTSLKIFDGTIATGDLSDDLITNVKLRDDASVDANRAVTTDHIRDGAISNIKLGTDISAAKITAGTLAIARGGTNSTATPTNGGIAFGTGTAFNFSAVGTSGQLLQSNGAATPAWIDPSSVNWTLSGTSSAVDGTHFIGTINSVALNFRVNNQKAGRIDPSGNLFFGYQAGNVNTATTNTGLGFQALLANTSGAQNTAVGSGALSANQTGSNNTAVGFGASTGTALSNATAIGANTTVSTSNSVVLGNSANVGIGTSSPAEKLDVVGNVKASGTLAVSGDATLDGFVRIGSEGPLVKMKKFTGSTVADNTDTVIAHGIGAGNTGKIISVLVWIESTASTFYVPPGYPATIAAGLEYYVVLSGSNIRIKMTATNSTALYSKPYKIIITYEN